MSEHDELVEKVARLIHGRTMRFGENTCWDNVRVLSDQRVLSNLGRDLYRNIARDIIAAMPTAGDGWPSISPELIDKLSKLANYLTEQGEYEACDLIDTVVERLKPKAKG